MPTGITAHSVFTTITSASSTETKPEEKTERRVSQEPPYKVILHNDDYTPMEHVIAVLRKVIPRMSMRRAVSIMLEAHTNGKAVATKCHKELAELYEEGLRTEGLIATIEPDWPIESRPQQIERYAGDPEDLLELLQMSTGLQFLGGVRRWSPSNVPGASDTTRPPWAAVPWASSGCSSTRWARPRSSSRRK